MRATNPKSNVMGVNIGFEPQEALQGSCRPLNRENQP